MYNANMLKKMCPRSPCMNMWVTNCQGWKNGDPGYVPASNGTAESPSNPDPQRPGSFGIYLNGQWSRLDIDPDRIPAHDPIGSLDVSLLHDLILDPILDIADERTDPAIEFVGGIRGNTALAARETSFCCHNCESKKSNSGTKKAYN